METQERLILNITGGNLGYDAEGCPRCMSLATRYGIKKPSGFFNATVREIEKTQRERFIKYDSLKSICADFPDGKPETKASKDDEGKPILVAVGGRPKTIPLFIEGCEVTLSGSYDYLIPLKSGGYAACIFKTAIPKEKNMPKIEMQMNCLAYTLSRHKDHDKMRDVREVGIMVFDPNAYDKGEDYFKYVHFDIDLPKFEQNLSGVVKVLKGSLPGYSDDCEYCKYQKKIAELTQAS